MVMVTFSFNSLSFIYPLPNAVHDTVDITETSLSKGMGLMTSAGSLLLLSLYPLKDG
jgi:hypothetical protein